MAGRSAGCRRSPSRTQREVDRPERSNFLGRYNPKGKIRDIDFPKFDILGVNLVSVDLSAGSQSFYKEEKKPGLFMYYTVTALNISNKGAVVVNGIKK